MRAAVTAVNLITGSAYTAIGVLIVIDLLQGWRTFGLSRFGLALAMIAFTCGPHHLVHGVHVGFEGHHADPLDFVTVLVGLPFGATWFLLRLEAVLGGPGDRFRTDRCWCILALPTLGGMYVTALVASALPIVTAGPLTPEPGAAVHVALVLIYLRIGTILVGTQIRSHEATSEWSVSGCAMAGIFLTCALMHAVTTLLALTDHSELDFHGLLINLVGVPAGLYFLSVVKRLQRAEVSDWNVVPADAPVSRVA